MIERNSGLRLRRALKSREMAVISAMGSLAMTASLFAILTARWLGPSDRGVVVVTATSGSLLMLLGSLGVSNGGRVLLARDPALPLTRFVTVARFLASLHIVTATVVGLSLLWVTRSLADPVVGLLFVPYAVLMLVSYLFREGLHGVGSHTTAVMGDVIANCCQTVLVVGAMPAGVVSLRFVLSSMVAGQAFQVGFLFWKLRKVQMAGGVGLTCHFRDRSTAEVIRYSLSAIPVIFGQAFVIRGDRLILGAFATSAAVGVYGAAASFTELLWLISGGVAQVAFKRSTTTRSGETSAGQRRVALAATAASCLVMILVAPAVVSVLLGGEYRDAVPLIWILSVAALPMASYQMDVSILNGLGEAKRAGQVTVGGSLSLAAGCLVLVPGYGATGAACASLAAYAVLALLARRQVRRVAAIQTVAA